MAAADAGSMARALGRIGNCDMLGKGDAVETWLGLVEGAGEPVLLCLGRLSLPDMVNIEAEFPPALTLTPGDDLPKFGADVNPPNDETRAGFGE